MDEGIFAQLHKDRDSVVTFCNKHKNIYLYGTGACANDFLLYLSEEGIEIKGFVVSEGHKSTDQYLNYPVYEVGQIGTENMGIILSVAEKYHGEIIEYLKGKGVDVENDVFAQKIFFPNNMNNLSSKDDYAGVEEDGEFFKNFEDLNDIGLQTGTDKSSLMHNYLRKYEFFLSHFISSPITLMELGVLKGESLKMWEEYYPMAKVIGVDIDEECKKYEDVRTSIELCNIGKLENLEKLGKKYSPDIIIDDASHFWSHQIKALVTLLPFVQNGGVYIMEDIGTSFGKYRNSVFSDSTISAYEFLSALTELVAGKELKLNTKIVDELANELRKLSKMIDMISFIYGSAVIVKR